MKQRDPQELSTWFAKEWRLLAAVSITGVIYNVGLGAGPWLEGQLAQAVANLADGSGASATIAWLSLAYVLNGVLGVERADLERDWESTFYPDIPNVVTNDTGKPFINGTYWRSSQHFDDGFAKYAVPGDTLRDRIERYLLACGVTKEEIENVREIMLEG